MRQAAPVEVTIRLVEDGPPIEGRIVNLEGRPVAGARIKVATIWFAGEGGLSAWLDRVRNDGVREPWQGLDPLPGAIEAGTDPDGRFRLAGIGRDRLAELLVSAPTIATAHLHAANRDGTAIRATGPGAMMREASQTTYHTRRFEYAAEPTRPIEGVVRDKDTGRPIAGIKLKGMVDSERSLVPATGVETTTDARGHYRLIGLSKGPAYRLFTEAARGQPYPRTTCQTRAGSPSLEPITFDIALRRGILVRGRVTDRATGRPVSGFVGAYTIGDNPQVRELTGYASYSSDATIGGDGRYEFVALPGRSLVGCQADPGRYRVGVGAAAIKDVPNTRPNIGDLVNHFHAVAEVKLDPKVESATLDFQVEPGRSLTIHADDPDGRPIAGTKATGLSELFPSIEYPQDSPTIEVRALEPSKPRRVTIRHDSRKLAAAVYLRGNEDGPLTVRLQGWGTLIGRIVDEDGRPRVGLSLIDRDDDFSGPAAARGILPGIRSSPFVPVGRDGRFRVEGLVPGLKYGASAIQGPMFAGDVFRGATVASGEVKDLGDLKVIPPGRDN